MIFGIYFRLFFTDNANENIYINNDNLRGVLLDATFDGRLFVIPCKQYNWSHLRINLIWIFYEAKKIMEFCHEHLWFFNKHTLLNRNRMPLTLHILSWKFGWNEHTDQMFDWWWLLFIFGWRDWRKYISNGTTLFVLAITNIIDHFCRLQMVAYVAVDFELSTVEFIYQTHALRT